MQGFRTRALCAVALVVVTGVAAVSCGSSTSNGGTSKSTTPKTRPTVTIEAADFSFTAPKTMPAGYVDVTVNNSGAESHHVQFIKLGSTSEADLKTAIDSGTFGSLDGAVFVGGPNGADPGGSATATIKLDPGDYEIVCLIPGADGQAHASKGMTSKVTVTKTAASVETAPKVDGTITLGDFTFEPGANFNGRGTYAIDNKGNQVHELAIFKFADGKTLDDVKGYLLTPPGTPPPAGPPPFTEAGGMVGLNPGAQAWLELDLEPGTYAMICFFPDPQKDNLPHALEGMIKEFRVT